MLQTEKVKITASNLIANVRYPYSGLSLNAMSTIIFLKIMLVWKKILN